MCQVLNELRDILMEKFSYLGIHKETFGPCVDLSLQKIEAF